jgi:hypothetical protein
MNVASPSSSPQSASQVARSREVPSGGRPPSLSRTDLIDCSNRAILFLSVYSDELERVLARVLAGTPISGLIDTSGLAKAIAAGFIGLQLYEGVDPEGFIHALDALDQLAALAGALDELGPILQRIARSRLRRNSR